MRTWIVRQWQQNGRDEGGGRTVWTTVAESAAMMTHRHGRADGGSIGLQWSRDTSLRAADGRLA
jgi:hypothetical protein